MLIFGTRSTVVDGPQGTDFFAEETLSIDRDQLVELKHSNVIRDIRR